LFHIGLTGAPQTRLPFVIKSFRWIRHQSIVSGYITLLAEKLKQRVRDRRPTMRVLLSFDFWPGHLEMFKAEGLHMAVLDMEHSSCDLRTAEGLCRTARLRDEIECSLFLMIQIESRECLAAVKTLAQHDWIDATMLGPYDLSLNLSQWGLMDHPEVVAAIRQVKRDSEAVSKPCGMVVGTPELAAQYIAEGFPLILIPDASYLARLQLRAFLACTKPHESSD
jgi:2-keto-3-deoxy-L-rhamnonate aldolase RhmA